jgi:serine/threonine-protein kinase
MSIDERATHTSAPGRVGPPTDRPRFVAGTVLAGRYRIVTLLGRGGMGEVYQADDLTLEQPVALKFLPATLGLHSDALARFHGEARVARQVAHPNVCRADDVGEVDGLHNARPSFVHAMSVTPGPRVHSR